jgi:hypothetical protein
MTSLVKKVRPHGMGVAVTADRTYCLRRGELLLFVVEGTGSQGAVESVFAAVGVLFSRGRLSKPLLMLLIVQGSCVCS